MQLYFTRHGKTEWNQARRFQGMLGIRRYCQKVMTRSNYSVIIWQLFL